MALVPAKKNNTTAQKVKDADASKPTPWGFNPMQKQKKQVDDEVEKLKQDDAKQKFKEIQQQKKDAAKSANPSLKVFMAQMNEMDKKEKRDAKSNNVNPMIKNAQVKEVNPAAFQKTGADKVPAEAGQVNDDESNSKMV